MTEILTLRCRNYLIVGWLVYSCFCLTDAYSQPPGEWTWMSGDSVTGGTGVFGTQGIPSPLNHPPGFYEACEWTDLQGNFWLFGGVNYGVGDSYGDLWKYDPSVNMWTWVNGTGTGNTNPVWGTLGVAAPTNQPGSRSYGMFAWTDLSGDLWLYGGQAGTYADLWKYNIATNLWTWMSGTNVANSLGNYGTQGVPSVNNFPAARSEGTSAWTDNQGNLWLFGGGAYNFWNDLWKYNISTNEWTWMNGSNTTGAPAVYGTKGISAPANNPGGRNSYSHWKDKAGNFWIFGGADSIFGGADSKNDLWKYDISINQWTWMSGTNVIGDSGVYGLLCDSNVNDLPGARFENKACWTDSCGNFWLMGGFIDAYSGNLVRNDLWQCNPVKNIWKLISGDSTINQNGIYGNIGISNPANIPGCRGGASSWLQTNGNLWLFGGFPNGAAANTLSDLWRYVPDPSCGGCALSVSPVANFISSDTAFCGEPLKCISFTDQSTNNPTSWQWLFAGATPDTSSQQNPTNICYYNVGTYPVTLIVSNAAGSDTLTVSPMITVGSAPQQPVITVVGDTLYSSHAAHYQWYLNGAVIPNATDSFYIASQGGTYSVQIADSTGCNSLSVGLAVGIEEISGGGGVEVYPNPASQSAVISWQSSVGGNIEITVVNVLGEKVYSSRIEAGNTKQVTINCKPFAAGIYILRISSQTGVLNKKIVIER